MSQQNISIRGASRCLRNDNATVLGFVVGPNVPHLNAVLQPKMEVGGREVNKYECHLCQAVFLRVKDLAKHRERQCTAWSHVA